MLPATIKQALVLNVGQCIDLPPGSVQLPRQQPLRQLWPMSGLFLLDVYGCYALSRTPLMKKGFLGMFLIFNSVPDVNKILRF